MCYGFQWGVAVSLMKSSQGFFFSRLVLRRVLVVTRVLVVDGTYNTPNEYGSLNARNELRQSHVLFEYPWDTTLHRTPP